MDSQISMVVELQVNEGQLDALKAVMEEMVEATRSEEGALSYEWHISEDESTVHVYERYADSDAAVAHGRNAMQFLPKMIAAGKPARVSAYGEPSDEVRQMFGAMGATWYGNFGGFVR